MCFHDIIALIELLVRKRIGETNIMYFKARHHTMTYKTEIQLA
jgi:hypothetical protein